MTDDRASRCVSPGSSIIQESLGWSWAKEILCNSCKDTSNVEGCSSGSSLIPCMVR